MERSGAVSSFARLKQQQNIIIIINKTEQGSGYENLTISSIDKCSQTQLLKRIWKTTINICIAKSCFYIAVLTTTCFGSYIGHHQVVYSLIFNANYTIYNVFVNEISCTSIESAFKVITVAVKLKSYSEIKDINRITFLILLLL